MVYWPRIFTEHNGASVLGIHNSMMQYLKPLAIVEAFFKVLFTTYFLFLTSPRRSMISSISIGDVCLVNI